LSILALTVITSMRDEDLAEVGVSATVAEQVIRLATLAAAAGCDGVVASPQEARLLREHLPQGMLVVTPGTQLNTEVKSDHARVATPFDAIRWGSSHVVMGRAVTRSTNPAAALAEVREQMARAAGP
jgi:orotidine-5'-phosphate decarboxylase